MKTEKNEVWRKEADNSAYLRIIYRKNISNKVTDVIKKKRRYQKDKRNI